MLEMDIIRRREKFLKSFKVGRKKYFVSGLGLILIFLALVYFGPFDGAGLLGKKKKEEQPSLAQAVSTFSVAQDHQVGALLSNATNGQISGQDGGLSVFADNQSFWAFGDTFVGGGSMIHNSVAKTTDFNASDGINLTYKVDAKGIATPLIPNVPGELAVWPDGMVQTQTGYVYIYYDPLVSCPSCSTDPNWQWKSKGVGLAKFDTKTMTATRTKAFWNFNTYNFGGARTLVSGDYVYIFFDYKLARVPKNQIENSSQYSYWNGNSWVLNGWSQAVKLWTETYPANGLSVSYNNYLGKWLAVYTPGGMGTVEGRIADSLTGPWSDPVILIKCSDFVSGNWPLCYTGIQHPEFQLNSGQTIYVTFANSATAKLYLHEIILNKNASTPTPTPTPIPSKITATVSGTNVSFSWTPLPGAARLIVWNDLTKACVDGNTGVITGFPVDIAANKSTYNWTGATPGTYKAALGQFSGISPFPVGCTDPFTVGGGNITATPSVSSVTFNWPAQPNPGEIVVWPLSSPNACNNVNADLVENSGILPANSSIFTWAGAPNGTYKVAFAQYVAGNVFPVGCIQFTVSSTCYDVPTPANPDPTPNGTRNGVVDDNDLKAVGMYQGARRGGPPNQQGLSYDSDKNGDGIPDGQDYDLNKDGWVNSTDLLIVSKNEGQVCTK